MGYHRRGALDHLGILASRFMPQNPTFRHSVRSCKSWYLDSGSKGAIFNGFSSWCSISQRLGAQGVVGVNGNFHNLFPLGAKRFYCIDPYNVQHFKPRGLRHWFKNFRHVCVVMVGSGVLITVYFGNLETVPCTNRTHLILLSKAFERRLGENEFEQIKVTFKGKILPPINPQSVRVTMIAREIVGALQRGLRKDNASEHTMLVEGDGRETFSAWVHQRDKILDEKKCWKYDQQRRSKATTSHLDGLNWEILIVNEPVVNALCLPGGKIVLFSGLFEHFQSDAEIATIIAHEVGHAVARHSAEGITKKLSFGGYDPRVAPGVYEKLGKIAGDSTRMDYLSTHPSGIQRAELLAQANIMEEAFSIYRDVRKGRRVEAFL